ncbi:histidine kinase [Terrimonas sp. NA20]|uniref:Histidine kinase n=1 Tax=Terrimonas ginsenosidimutans TaxID=2908004 RepID=A0ABS9KUC2_9BACT|nr:sensor histidine kinase [Terrimonas ginsenosidimutans]MCG2615902.1 histidine kinase [Terrimonas ginsenosidimutans]
MPGLIHHLLSVVHGPGSPAHTKIPYLTTTMRLSLLTTILCVLSFAVLAQVKPFSFRNISIDQGLSQSSVVDIMIDKTGFTWLATQDGLNRYDGHSFIKFPLNFDDITTPANNQLGKIAKGDAHSLWLITRGGRLQKMDLLTQSISPFSKIKNETIPPVSCILQDSSFLVIGTIRDGLWIYDHTKDQLHKLSTGTHPGLTSNGIKKVFKDSKKCYWVLTGSGAVLLSPELKIRENFLSDSEQHISPSSITEDAEGRIWIGSFGKSVFYKEPDDTSFRQFTQTGNHLLKNDLVVETIHADQNGLLWIGTFTDGLYVLDQRHQIIHHLLPDRKNPFSIGYLDVLCMAEDQHGGLWIGTDGGGVSYYDKRLDNFETFSRNNLPDHISIEQVRAITTDRENNIWVGTSVSGLTFLGKQTTPVGNYRKIGSLLTDQDGDIWVGTQENGLDLIDARSKKVIRRFLPGQTIWNMILDPSGNIWVATRNNGISLVSKTKGLLLHLDEHSSPSLAENNVRALAITPDHKLFIAFERSGIQQLDIARRKLIALPSPIDSIFDGSVLVRSMYLTPKTLWIGTFGNGLLAFRLTDGKVTAITESQGLRNNTIYGILPDQDGGIWLSTNKGLCRLRLADPPEEVRRSDMYFFSMEDGLQSNEFNTGAHHRSPDGTLFFGGIAGLTRFHPAGLSTGGRPANVIITDVQAEGETLHTDTLIIYKKTLKLPYKQNSLSFTFAAPDVLSAGRLHYSYQLVGFDKDWIDAGTRNYAAYTHLPAGKYRFRVKASRDLSTEPSQITSLEIIIKPPFWQTVWFISLCGLCIAASLYGLYRNRISQLIRLQKVRNRIASDLHDDIGSALTHINILSELSKTGIDPKSETSLFLNRISEEVTTSGQALDDIVWSINSNNDTMEQMVARMRRYVAEVFETNIDHFSLEFDDRFAHRKLNMEQRRDFFLLFKELINNTYKHARASKVDIRIWIEKNRLNMYISDNGCGFDKTIETSRNGLKNMQARTEKWSGSFTINTQPGKGTITNISMPLV